MKKYLIALVMIVMILSCFFGKTLVMANEESDDTVYNRYQILLHTASSFVSSESKLMFANICSALNSITRTYVCQFFFGIFRTKVCFFPYFMVLCIQMKKGGIS